MRAHDRSTMRGPVAVIALLLAVVIAMMLAPARLVYAADSRSLEELVLPVPSGFIIDQRGANGPRTQQELGLLMTDGKGFQDGYQRLMSNAQTGGVITITLLRARDAANANAMYRALNRAPLDKSG